MGYIILRFFVVFLLKNKNWHQRGIRKFWLWNKIFGLKFLNCFILFFLLHTNERLRILSESMFWGRETGILVVGYLWYLGNNKPQDYTTKPPRWACRSVCVCARNQRSETRRGAKSKLPPMLRNVARILIWLIISSGAFRAITYHDWDGLCARQIQTHERHWTFARETTVPRCTVEGSCAKHFINIIP